MIVHLNGQLLPASEARVSPFDRGFCFGDGIYEGLRSFSARVVGMDLHIKRMRQGLAEIRLPWEAGNLAPLSDELLAANKLADAFLYWQVSRGVPPPGQNPRARNFNGPVKPTVFGYCFPTPPLASHTEPATKTAAIRPDHRWLRGHVKSISLLGGVVAGLEASDQGADDAILVRDGIVGEGTSSNVIAVLPTSGGTEIVTPSLESASILAGVTRDLLLRAAPEIVQRPLRVDELTAASEVMLLGTLTMVTAITKLDGRPVGNGAAGPVARRLLATLCAAIRNDIGL